MMLTLIMMMQFMKMPIPNDDDDDVDDHNCDVADVIKVIAEAKARAKQRLASSFPSKIDYRATGGDVYKQMEQKVPEEQTQREVDTKTASAEKLRAVAVDAIKSENKSGTCVVFKERVAKITDKNRLIHIGPETSRLMFNLVILVNVQHLLQLIPLGKILLGGFLGMASRLADAVGATQYGTAGCRSSLSFY